MPLEPMAVINNEQPLQDDDIAGSSNFNFNP